MSFYRDRKHRNCPSVFAKVSCVGKLLLQPTRNRAHVCLRLCDTQPGFDSTHGKYRVVSAPSRVQVERGRSPQIRSKVRKSKIGRHDADNGKRLAIKRDRLAHNVRIGLEVVLPGPMAEHYRVGSGVIVFGRKRSTQLRFHLEDLEKRLDTKAASIRSGFPFVMRAGLS